MKLRFSLPLPVVSQLRVNLHPQRPHHLPLRKQTIQETLHPNRREPATDKRRHQRLSSFAFLLANLPLQIPASLLVRAAPDLKNGIPGLVMTLRVVKFLSARCEFPQVTFLQVTTFLEQPFNSRLIGEVERTVEVFSRLIPVTIRPRQDQVDLLSGQFRARVFIPRI